MPDYFVLHRGTGETVSGDTDFATEGDAYDWLRSQCLRGALDPPDIDEYAIEQTDPDDDGEGS